MNPENDWKSSLKDGSGKMHFEPGYNVRLHNSSLLSVLCAVYKSLILSATDLLTPLLMQPKKVIFYLIESDPELADIVGDFTYSKSAGSRAGWCVGAGVARVPYVGGVGGDGGAAGGG